jgi:hypothetical protein
MEKKKIIIEKPPAIAGLSLITVAQVSIHLFESKMAGKAFMASKQPLAAVAVLPTKSRAFRITGEEVPIEKLLQQYPSLRDYL